VKNLFSPSEAIFNKFFIIKHIFQMINDNYIQIDHTFSCLTLQEAIYCGQKFLKVILKHSYLVLEKI
jgi:hypothetical protein